MEYKYRQNMDCVIICSRYADSQSYSESCQTEDTEGKVNTFAYSDAGDGFAVLAVGLEARTKGYDDGVRIDIERG